jgi:hypothetical protein
VGGAREGELDPVDPEFVHETREIGWAPHERRGILAVRLLVDEAHELDAVLRATSPVPKISVRRGSMIGGSSQLRTDLREVMASAAAIATMSATIRIQVRPRGRVRSSRGRCPDRGGRRHGAAR